MDVLSDFKIGIAQLRVEESNRKAHEESLAKAREWAEQTECDLLVATGNDVGKAKPVLFACKESNLVVEDGRAVLSKGNASAVIDIGCQDRTADLRIECDWEPWTLRRSSSKKILYGRPLILIRPVGMTNAGHKVLAYDGGSAIWDNDGDLICRLPDIFEPAYAVVNAGMQEEEDGYKPALKTLNALANTIRRFDEEVLGYAKKWVIGLSGGLDSSIVTSLLAMSLGKGRVVGYSLATRNNSAATRKNAEMLANELGIEFRFGSIEDLVDATRLCSQKYRYAREETDGLVLENIQARVRGHMLSTFAAMEGGVVANNGNRIECALGYATLYGDAIGALAPIADLTKVELFELARTINDAFGCETVPENLLPNETEDGLVWDVAPSAELASGQKDPMKWYYHDWLVSELIDKCSGNPLPIMKDYRDGVLAEGHVGKWLRFYGLDDPREFVSDLEWVLKSMNKSAFKRIQAPPAITIASPATVHAEEPRQAVWEPPEGYDDMKRDLIGQ